MKVIEYSDPHFALPSALLIHCVSLGLHIILIFCFKAVSVSILNWQTAFHMLEQTGRIIVFHILIFSFIGMGIYKTFQA
jgi:uncharacterized membrane protein